MTYQDIEFVFDSYTILLQNIFRSGFAFAEKKQKLLADIVAKEEKEKTIVALLKTKDNDYHQLKESVSRFIKDEESVVNEKKIISYKIGNKKFNYILATFLVIFL